MKAIGVVCYVRIYNYCSFTDIPVHLVALSYEIGNAVFEIFPFYAKQPTIMYRGLKMWQ